MEFEITFHWHWFFKFSSSVCVCVGSSLPLVFLLPHKTNIVLNSLAHNDFNDFEDEISYWNTKMSRICVWVSGRLGFCCIKC